MRLTLLAILLLMLGAVALLGCDGGGDELSLKDYYAEVSRVQAQAEQRTPSANVNLGEIPAETPPEELRGLLKAGLRASRELNDAYLEDLKSIEPPAEAAAAHGELLAAIDAMNAWLENMIAGADGVNSLQEFGALADRSSFVDTEQAFIEACSKLDGIADRKGIAVDLQCSQ